MTFDWVAPAIISVAALVWLVWHLGWWRRPDPMPEPEPEPVWVRPEPWRDSHPAAVLLSTDILFALADPSEYTGALTHRFRVDPLIEDVEVNGLREPGVIHMDAQGKTVLADGNHRLVVHIEQGWPEMPVEIRNVRLIRGYGVPARRFVDLLLQERETDE